MLGTSLLPLGVLSPKLTRQAQDIEPDLHGCEASCSYVVCSFCYPIQAPATGRTNSPCPENIGSMDEKHRHIHVAQFQPANLARLWGASSLPQLVCPSQYSQLSTQKSALNFSCSDTFSPNSTSQPPAWRGSLWPLRRRSHMAGWLFSLQS